MTSRDKIPKELNIGSLKLKSIVVAAPMAGVTDNVFRQLVRSYSKNCLLMTEMLSSEALRFNKEQKILEHDKAEYPLSFQVSGHKPDLMAEGAAKLQKFASAIDINMGCPAPKIVRNLDGVRLMTDIKLASEIITSVKKAIEIPLTVKFRLGWDCNSKNYLEFAKMAEDCGADALIVHGRTRTQMYSGTANWEEIAKVKSSVKIPVIGNGDVVSPEKALECLNGSGCDGLAVGRAMMSDPTLIYRIEHYFTTGEVLSFPSIEERLDMALLHTNNEIKRLNNELNGIKFMRKFYAQYISGVRNAVKYRGELMLCTKIEQIENIFDEIRKTSELIKLNT